MLVALMTGPLTLKRRFLDKNLVKSCNFCKNFGLLEISIGCSTNYHHKRQIFQLYCCRVKRRVQKNATESWALFVTKIAKISDKSNFGAYSDITSLSLTNDLIHCSQDAEVNTVCEMPVPRKTEE